MFFYLRVLVYASILLFTSCHTIGVESVSLHGDKIKYLTLKGDTNDVYFIDSKDIILDFF